MSTEYQENDPEQPQQPPARLHRTPLPTSVSGLTRKSLRHKSIIDFVEDIFVKLYDESERFRALVEAVFDSDAVEGSTMDDDVVAAQMIREEARADSPVKDANLHTIRLALRRVMARWDIARKDRRRAYEAIES
jgi:hypothetical protein